MFTKKRNMASVLVIATAVAVVTGGTAAVAGPIALWATGFTGAGIAAGSTAAGMMSTLGSGSLIVATAQSAGAAGLAASTTTAAASLGAVAGFLGTYFAASV
jgi:hypothetical protein